MESHIANSNSVPGSSPFSPVLLGEAIRTALPGGTTQDDRQRYYAEITLLQTIRGNEAWEQVKDRGVTDEPPKVGFEYILAKIRLGYVRKSRGGKDEPYIMTVGSFVAISSDGKTEYEIPHPLRQPEPALIGYTFKAGETHEGWILLQVPKNESKPLLIFKREHAGVGIGGLWTWEPVWFQL